MKYRFTYRILALVALVPLLLACGGDDDTPVPAPTAAPAATAKPAAATAVPAPAATAVPAPKGRVPSGVLNVIDDQRSEVYLPRTNSGDKALALMLGRLFYQDLESLEVITGLAETWDIKSTAGGGADWTFNLREGVLFHKDWGELTAEDVKSSLTEFLKEGSTNPGTGDLTRWFGKDANNIEITGEHSLVVHSPQVDAGIWGSLARISDRGFNISSKKHMESVGDEGFQQGPVGTGPWEFVEQKKGERVTLNARLEHWRQVPYFATLNIFIVPEPSTQIAMVRTGMVDISAIPTKLKGEVEQAGIRIIRSTNTLEYFVNFGGLFLTSRPLYDTDVPWAGENPMDEKPRMVREALNLAVDKEAIIESILLGEGSPAAVTFNFGGPGTPWWNPKWKPYPYDPTRAKELLTQAGYPDGFTTGFWMVSGEINTIDVAEVVASYWEQVGIKVERRVAEYRPTLRSMLVDRGTAGWAYVKEQQGVSDPLSYGCGSCCGGESSMTLGHTEAPFWDETCPLMKQSLELDDLYKHTKTLGDYLYDNYWTVPLAYGNVLYAVGPKIGEWTPLRGQAGIYTPEYASPA